MRLPCDYIRGLDTLVEGLLMHLPQCEGVRVLQAVLCLLMPLFGGSTPPELTVFVGSLAAAWPVPRPAQHSQLWSRTLRLLPSRKGTCDESNLSDGWHS